MRREIAIVACGKAKNEGTHAAAELYKGQAFKANLKAARSQFDEVYILSAKHGIVALDSLLDDYDTIMGDDDAVTPADIELALAELDLLSDVELFVFGSKRYFEPVWSAVADHDALVSQVFEGNRGIGDQGHLAAVLAA